MGEYNMSTVQTDGSSAVTVISTKNKGGTVVAAGSAASGVVQSRQASTYSFSAFASTVIDGTDTDDANGGTFAYNNPRPIAMRYTTALAGVSNTFLRSGSSNPGERRVVNKTESVRTNRYATAIRDGDYNVYTGTFSSAPTVAEDSFGTDNAASPTSAVPGTLVYKIGNPVPFSADYSAKTGF